MNRQIRILDDDSRFYLIFENPSQEDKKAVVDFVADFYKNKKINPETEEETETLEIPEKPEVEKAEHVMPIKVETPVIPKKEKIPEIYSVRGFIQNYQKSPTYSEEGRKKLYKKLKGYLENYLGTVKRDNKKNMETFLKSFEPVLKNTIQKYLNENGYGANLDSYIETESLEKVQNLFDLCKDTMLKGLS